MSETAIRQRIEELADEVESWIEEPDFSWDDAQAGLQKVLDALRGLCDDDHAASECQPEICGGTHYDPCDDAAPAGRVSA